MKDIVKEYGDVLHDPASITDEELSVISVSPKLDIALGGGVPEGSLFIMTGPEKVGKTVTALTFCANAQRLNRKTYYGNIEGRLRKRDIEGIKELTSISSENNSSVTVEIYEGFDIDEVLQNVKNSVDAIYSFPKGAEKPTVKKQNSRGTLYKSFVEVVKRVKPKIFVAENVKGLIKTSEIEISGN